MSSKHFVDNPTLLLQTSLSSLPSLNPSLSLDLPSKTIYLTHPPPNTVSLLSGGGSGHEPSFTSFVGHGLLTAAVAGTIFASPSAEQVRRCISNRIPQENGVLVIVMNYTGDVLNFGMGVEKARARGTEVDMVVVGDDAGVGRERGGKVGRRGIAGTCLVLKVAGALAAKGASLKEVSRIAKLTAANLVSIGSSLGHVHVPGRSIVETGVEELKDSEVEIGMGIHNEDGSERRETDLPGLVKTMLSHCLNQADKDRSFLNVSKTDDVVLLVNNLGGVSVLELGAITSEVLEQLDRDYEIRPVRILAGTFMTSLNGLGFSISLLKVADTGLGAGSSMIELLDAPSEATGWSAAIKTDTWSKRRKSVEEHKAVEEEVWTSNLRSEITFEFRETAADHVLVDPALTRSALTTALTRLIAAEADVTRYDTVVGDGDCGIGLKRGAEAILEMLRKAKQTDDALTFVQSVTQVVELAMDGTSGAIYAIFLNALAHGLSQNAPSSPQPITTQVWAAALQSAIQTLGKYTPAKPGDRTLMDALCPFAESLSKAGDIEAAAKAAEEGAKNTQGMRASLGRTVYVGGEGWQGVPDPGAHGLAVLLQGLSEGLRK
ncbi:dihydroxyacetone kinase [Massarina eburnea CBS 473.64]|uniref:Dihydroxyacetone kinase n=1 Tax=Massarina eburnea CBS 473.64 TaxID=1395130 RepID=A0A6A6S8I0_9PLEO|nr:dihydroxyacetone kinase [Massarina eburnea CBS 473.64]